MTSPANLRIQTLFGLSGLAPVVALFFKPPTTILLIYTVFVMVWFYRRALRSLVGRIPIPPAMRLLLCFWIGGVLCETLAWTDNYLRAAAEPALLHPQLFCDLYLGLGFYGGWAVVWMLLLRRLKFDVKSAFLTTGILGIAFEQLGAVVVMIALTLPVNPLLAIFIGLYVVLVYGSVAGLAFIGADPDTSGLKTPRWWFYPVAAALLAIGAASGTWLAAGLAFPFGGLPPKGSIIERPFW